MTGKTRVSLASVVFLLPSFLLACTGADEPQSPSVTHHEDGEGVLSAGSGDGGALAVEPLPGVEDWSTTFGLFVLCTRGGQEVALEKVTWKQGNGDGEVVAYVRHVPDSSHRKARLDYSPAVVRGTPKTANPPLGGNFVTHIAGSVIASDCSHPVGPNGARDDLVLVARASREGVAIRDISVEYSVGDEKHSLDLDYELVMCGSKILDESC